MARKKQLLPPHHFVDLTKVNHGIVIDLIYATTHNITGHPLYAKPLCYVHYEVAMQLNKVEQDLEEIGLKLKIFDAYRPLSVQKQLWDIVQDERYVSNPDTDKTPHARGTAVDVTLVTARGAELEMPTAFDEFTLKAHSDYQKLPKKVLEHRNLLKDSMERHGFIQLPTEWWHFDYAGWDNEDKYPCFDLTLEEVEKQLTRQPRESTSSI